MGMVPDKSNFYGIIKEIAKTCASTALVYFSLLEWGITGTAVERHFRDARGLMLYFKTMEWLRQDIAKAVIRV